jgi:hypothetical protein
MFPTGRNDQMRSLSIVVCLTWLTVCVASSVCAQNTVPEDEKGPSHLQQDKPQQEQPNPLPAEKMNEPGSISTGQGEIDSNDTRPRTRDDVIREIHPSDKHRPVPPR